LIRRAGVFSGPNFITNLIEDGHRSAEKIN